MSDGKERTKGFFTANIATQLIILIIVIIFSVTNIGTNIITETKKNENDTQILSEMTQILKEMKQSNDNIEALFIRFTDKQEKIDDLKECMNEKHNEAITLFDDVFTIELGKTLAGLGVMQFPTDLNRAFMDFKKVFFLDMKNCFIIKDNKK